MSTIRIAIFASSAVAMTLLCGAMLTSRTERASRLGERPDTRGGARVNADAARTDRRDSQATTRAAPETKTGATLGGDRGALPSAPVREVAGTQQSSLHPASRTTRVGDFNLYIIERQSERGAAAHGGCLTDLDPSDLAALSDLLAGSTSELSEAWSTPEGDVIALALDSMGNVSVVVVEPPRLPADMNKDARIDTDDLSVFMQAMQAGDPRADIDDNGTLDIFDIQEFTRHLTEGGM